MGSLAQIDRKRESSGSPDDADGNMTHRIKAGVDTEYKWDDFDRLKRVESTENAVTTRLQDNRYDVNGIRKRKLDKNGNSSTEYTAGITTSVSKGGSGSSAAPSISYVMGHMLLGAEIDGVFRFHLMDAQGSVRDVVDDSGAVIRSMEFQEHGLPISSSGSGTFSPKTYQGGLSVNDDTNDSGLYLMGHRFWAADLGRFISRDPIGFNGGLNLYGTAFGNNPVTFVDPSGLKIRFNSNLTSGQKQSASQWLAATKQSGSPIRSMVLALEADPRTLTISPGSNLGYPALTDSNIVSHKSKRMGLFGWADSAEIFVDFEKFKSKEALDDCDGKPEIIFGHELGHAYHSFFAGTHALITKKTKQSGVRIDGIAIDEVLIMSTFEEPFRKFLGAPSQLLPSTVEKADAFMREKTPYGLIPPTNWKF